MKKLLLLFTFATLALIPLKASVTLHFSFDGLTAEDEVYIYPWITVDGQDMPLPDYAWPVVQLGTYINENGTLVSTEGLYDFYKDGTNYSFNTVNFLLHRGIPDGATEPIAKSQDFRGAINGDWFVYGSGGSLSRNTLEMLQTYNELFKNDNGVSNYQTNKNYAYFAVPGTWDINTGCAAWPYSAAHPAMAGTWPGDVMTWAAYMNEFTIYRWEQGDNEEGTPEKIIFNNNLAQGASQSPEYDFVNGGIYLGDYGLLATVPEAVEINATNFPDNNFRTYVSAFDLDNDSKLNAYERYRVMGININKKDVASVVGIGFFPEIIEATLSNNRIQSLDFSGNPKLRTLNMQSNNTTPSIDLSTAPNLQTIDVANNDMLKTLTLTGLTKVKSLRCGNTLVSSLDVTAMPLLESLSCSWCDINTLDLSNCPNITTLSCGSNSMTSLDITGCTKLRNIDCEYGSLTSLDVSQCTELEELNCASNRITALNVANSPKLRNLDCSYNCLKTLDVSNCPQLYSLKCEGGELSSELMSSDVALYFDNDDIERLLPYLAELAGNEIATLDLSNCPELQTLECSGNKLTTLNLSNNRKLNNLKADNNQLTNITLSDSTALYEINLSDNMLTTVEGLTRNTNLSELNLSNNPIANITALGSNQLPNLRELKLSGIDLSGLNSLLDVSPDSIRTLSIANCNLSNVDLSVIRGVKELEISSNPLQSLNLASFNMLERLSASGCGLTGLTLPTATDELNVLIARANNLETLDLSAYTKLVGINVGKNKLTSLILPTSSSEEMGMLDCSFNQLESLDVSAYSNMLVMKANNNKIKSFTAGDGMIAPNLSNNMLSGINLSNRAIMSIPAMLHMFAFTDDGLESTQQLIDSWQFTNPNSSLEWFGNFYKSITRGEYMGNALPQIFFALYLMMPLQAGIDDLSVSISGNCRDMQAQSFYDRQTQKAVYYIKLADAEEEQPSGAPRRVNLNSDDMFGPGFNPDAVSNISGGTVETHDDGVYLVLNATSTDTEAGKASGTITYDYNTGAMAPATLIQALAEDEDLTPEQTATAAEYFPDMSKAQFSFNWEAPIPTEVHTGILNPEKAAVQLVETRYISTQGITSSEPFQGVNIIVKIYDDGHKTIEKVRF